MISKLPKVLELVTKTAIKILSEHLTLAKAPIPTPMNLQATVGAMIEYSEQQLKEYPNIFHLRCDTCKHKGVRVKTSVYDSQITYSHTCSYRDGPMADMMIYNVKHFGCINYQEKLGVMDNKHDPMTADECSYLLSKLKAASEDYVELRDLYRLHNKTNYLLRVRKVVNKLLIETTKEEGD